MDFSDIFWLSIVVILSAFLFFKDVSRSKHGSALENEQIGHGIDVCELSNRLQEVRSNFPAAMHTPGNTANRKSLITSARRIIGQLPYFQRQTASRQTSAEHEVDGQ